MCRSRTEYEDIVEGVEESRQMRLSERVPRLVGKLDLKRRQVTAKLFGAHRIARAPLGPGKRGVCGVAADMKGPADVALISPANHQIIIWAITQSSQTRTL
jgi:hypothetical protein